MYSCEVTRFSLASELKAGLVRGTGESEEGRRRFEDPEDMRFSGGKAEVRSVWKELAWSSALKTVESGSEVIYAPSPTRGRFELLVGAETFEVSAITERSGIEEAARSLDRFPILRLISKRVVSSLSVSDKGDVRA